MKKPWKDLECNYNNINIKLKGREWKGLCEGKENNRLPNPMWYVITSLLFDFLSLKPMHDDRWWCYDTTQHNTTQHKEGFRSAMSLANKQLFRALPHHTGLCRPHATMGIKSLRLVSMIFWSYQIWMFFFELKLNMQNTFTSPL